MVYRFVDKETCLAKVSSISPATSAPTSVAVIRPSKSRLAYRAARSIRVITGEVPA